jgi:hypothetical protein
MLKLSIFIKSISILGGGVINMNRITAITIILLGILAVDLAAQKDLSDKARSLKGIGRIGIHVTINDKDKLNKVRDRDIERDIELKLRIAGIQVTSESEFVAALQNAHNAADTTAVMAQYDYNTLDINVGYFGNQTRTASATDFVYMIEFCLDIECLRLRYDVSMEIGKAGENSVSWYGTIDKMPIWVCAWNATAYGLTPPRVFEEQVRSAVNNIADEFANDYLKANPKK